MTELDKLPLYELHTMYYQFWKEKEAESKLTTEQKQSKALGELLEDHM